MKDLVLITGGTGYLGGRISAFLAGHLPFLLRLTTLDSSRTLSGPGEIVAMDLMDTDQAEEACRGARYVIHLAAMNEIDSARDPAGAVRINTEGTVNLLQIARKEGVERFIYFSTAHVYGAPLQGHIDENTMPRPVHPYAITHKAAEDFVLASTGMEPVVIRLSNAIGSPAHPEVDRWTLVVNDLCRQAVTRGSMELKSSGLQWRDFVAMSDVCHAVLHLLQLPASLLGDGIFNVGGERPIKIYDIAQLIARRCEILFGFAPPLRRVEPLPGEEYIGIDYSMARLKATGFTLSGSLEKEIDETLLFCRRNFGEQ